MHRVLVLACVIATLASVVCAQDAPATAPARTETLANGALVFTPPAGAKSLGRRADDRSVGYELAGAAGQIIITAAPQQQSIPDTLAPKLKAQLVQRITDEAAKGNIAPVTPVRSETDDQFLLKLHDRYRAEGKFIDRMQFYAGIGRNLVSVVCLAYTENESEAAKVHALAQKVMLDIHLNRPGAGGRSGGTAAGAPSSQASRPPTSQPMLFREARLRMPPPAGWTAEPSGKPSGLIVLWRDPADQTNLIAVSYRMIPPEARDNAGLRNLAIQELVRGEKPELLVAGGKPIGQPQPVPDRRFLAKSRIDYDVKDAKARLTMRQIRAGDGVVSVTSLSLMDKADQIEALADAIAEGTRTTMVGQ